MLRCEGCVQCWEVSSLHPLGPTEARGTCVKRVGILVDHFQPMYLWPGNTNLTQVGTYARQSLSYLPSGHSVPAHGQPNSSIREQHLLYETL